MNKDYYGGNIPWLKTGDLNDGTIIYIPEYITQRALEETSVRLNPKGSVLIAMYGATIGKIGILSFPATTNQACCACYEYSINQMFLFYFLLANRENFIAMGGGGAQPNISKEKIISTNMPLPPLKEQERIVEEIERWLSFVDIVEKEKSDLQLTICLAKSKILDLAIHGKLVPQDLNDEPASELLKRINPKAVITCDNPQYGKLPKGWILTKVKDVFSINPKNKAETTQAAGFIPMTNICEGFKNQYSYETKEWGKIESGFTHFADGDIAVAKISPCLENRKSMVLGNLPNGIGAGTTELHVFRPLCVDALYGLYFFKSDCFIKNCVGTFNGVVGQQRVGKSIVKEIHFPLPPLTEQHRIVTKIEELFAQLDKIEASL